MEEMDVFLGPNLRHLPRLEEWPGLVRAADVLAAALDRNETVAVWGDYDVDGVSATALVTEFLRERGYSVLPRLPERSSEGYGLNAEGIRSLAEQGAKTLVTVDCGIADASEVRLARELGMTVVVSDHHLPGEDIPPAHAVVDAHLEEGCPYSRVAGVGAAFLLMAALNRILPGEAADMRRYLDLVALGTIADVVELTGENRILVKNGLLLLGEARRPGVFALKEASGLPPTAPMGSGQVGFGLGPRINAAGRMGSAHKALDLLLAPDLDTARPLAAELEKLNETRRRQEEEILKEALEQAGGFEADPGLVLYGPNWHPGVIGIVASRVAERFYRPALLLTDDGEVLKGSGRSIPEFDLYRGLAECGGTLQGFGGHRQAAGLTVRGEDLEGLRESFCSAVRGQLGPELPAPSLQVEARLGLDMVTLPLVKEIELLQPFGPGNPKPLFCSRPLRVQKRSVFGSNHVSLEVRDDQAAITMLAKAWRQSERIGDDIRGSSLEIAFTPRLNHYNGMISIDLDVKDWRKA
jgi:single-stranded-DNA-specific exonuclease